MRGRLTASYKKFFAFLICLEEWNFLWSPSVCQSLSESAVPDQLGLLNKHIVICDYIFVALLPCLLVCRLLYDLPLVENSACMECDDDGGRKVSCPPLGRINKALRSCCFRDSVILLLHLRRKAQRRNNSLPFWQFWRAVGTSESDMCHLLKAFVMF